MRRVFRLPFTRSRLAREVDDELAFHLETRIQRLVADGWTYDAARNEALRQFGDVEAVRTSMLIMDEQRERATRRANMMTELQQDLVYAVRTLRRNIGFTAVIVGALALGIGANTAIFTLIDAVLVRTLPVPHPEQLVAVGDPRRVSSFSQGSPRTDLLSVPLYEDLLKDNTVFTDALASGRADRLDAHIDSTGGEFEHPRGRYVSANYFSVLGVPAFRGRTFEQSIEGVTGGSPTLVISAGYWTRRFLNDPSVVGRTIRLDGLQMTIVGIAPPSFTGDIVGASPDVWIPLAMYDALNPNRRVLADRLSDWLLMLGRLKPGVTLAQVTQQLQTLMQREIVQNAKPLDAKAFLGQSHKYYISDGSRGFSRVRETFHAPLMTLMIGVALLLCIICANVANLLLARSIARGREMAVRLALGADRARIVRQLMTESMVLAVLSAGVGLLVAWWASRGLLRLAADGGTIPIDLGMDLPVLAFTLTVSVLAVALFGLAPAIRGSRVELATTMRSSTGSISGGLGARGARPSLARALIAGQVALSIVLLMGAALLVRSLTNLQGTSTGMDRDHLALVDLDITSRGYKGPALADLVERLTDRVSTVPGVAAVTFSENGIFSGTESQTTLEIPGFVARTPDDTMVAYDQVGAQYAHIIGAKITDGRDLASSDENRLARTALVNQSFASFYFPNRSAVGQFFHTNDTVGVEIVGVVADTRDHDLTTAPLRRAYFPYLHTADAGNLDYPGSLRLIVRTKGDPNAVLQPVRKAVTAVDPQLPIDNTESLTNLMRATIRQERLLARLATAFGVLALLLAAVGLYGVMTYAITRRTGEIGLRVALGAQRTDVVTMVLREALVLVGLGVVVGLPVALAATRLLRTQLHDVAAADPVSIIVAVGVLVASAVAAVSIPALRASRVSPLVALRAE